MLQASVSWLMCIPKCLSLSWTGICATWWTRCIVEVLKYGRSTVELEDCLSWACGETCWKLHVLLGLGVLVFSNKRDKRSISNNKLYFCKPPTLYKAHAAQTLDLRSTIPNLPLKDNLQGCEWSGLRLNNGGKVASDCFDNSNLRRQLSSLIASLRMSDL